MFFILPLLILLGFFVHSEPLVSVAFDIEAGCARVLLCLCRCDHGWVFFPRRAVPPNIPDPPDVWGKR